MFGPILRGASVTLRPLMENEPSKRALWKAGYRQVGVEREETWRDGRWHDHRLCEILRSDRERDRR
ncbi:MAG: GNAT family N-acetyltransferase [Chloroflexota bacterium]|nr:GNAT family N-acetyltransferase [Chloroflexota bacterium]